MEVRIKHEFSESQPIALATNYTASSVLHIMEPSTLLWAGCSFTPARTSDSFSSLLCSSSTCVARLSPAALTTLQHNSLQPHCKKAESRWVNKTTQGKHRAGGSYDSIQPDIVKLNVGEKESLLLKDLFQLHHGIWVLVLLLFPSLLEPHGLCIQLGNERSFVLEG